MFCSKQTIYITVIVPLVNSACLFGLSVLSLLSPYACVCNVTAEDGGTATTDATEDTTAQPTNET